MEEVGDGLEEGVTEAEGIAVVEGIEVEGVGEVMEGDGKCLLNVPVMTTQDSATLHSVAWRLGRDRLKLDARRPDW